MSAISARFFPISVAFHFKHHSSLAVAGIDARQRSKEQAARKARQTKARQELSLTDINGRSPVRT
jgi:hypothetical protein